MKKTNYNPKAFRQKRRGKDNINRVQTQETFKAFYPAPKTMLMVSAETRILRANICRYVGTLCRENKIYFIKYGICPISKHRAGFYTTNELLAQKYSDDKK